MDRQAWQYMNGLRIYCLPCISRTTTEGGCRCKLVDVRGRLTYPGDQLLFPHSIENDRCYRCLTRRSVRPKACDLRMSKLAPVLPFTGAANLTIILKCARARCDHQWIFRDGLESFRGRSDYWEWLTNVNTSIARSNKWIKVAALAPDISPFAAGIRKRIILLKRYRREVLAARNRGIICIDTCLLNLYGIATLLAMRQTCKAWQYGVTIEELAEMLDKP